MTNAASGAAWPTLAYSALRDTCETLQLWTQIVGKLRLAQSPWLNHSWHTPFYVSARGLGTSLIPHASGAFDAEFDFVNQRLVIRASDGESEAVALAPISVRDFYRDVVAALDGLGRPVRIHAAPNELPEAIPFDEDTRPRAYEPEQARAFWLALTQAHRVLSAFRTGFLGKASPVHFFWGGFDLAVTRFSGRRAPLHPGGVPHLPDAVTREAYSHEVSSAGFWPGGGAVDYPAFYSYAYPEPAGFRDTKVTPAAASYSAELGEFILPYQAVQTAAYPDAVLMAFLESTYAAAAEAGAWDRATLECGLGEPGVPRPVA
jgi:hypothetical protein